MPGFDAIKNTKYIKSLSEEDLQKLMASMEEWPEERQNEFIEGILKMEESADSEVEKVMKEMEDGVESAVQLIKKGKRESRELDEQEEQNESLKEAEATLEEL